MLAGGIAFGVGGGPSSINVNSHRTSIVAIEGTLNRMIMKIMASVPSVTLDLFSCSLTYLLRENHDAIGSDAYVGVEVQPILAAWVGYRIEAIAIYEAGIVNVRAAVEPHMPLPPAREADVHIRQGHVRKVCHHHDIVAATAVLPSVVGQRLVAIVQVKDVEILARQAAGLPRQVTP